MNIRHLLTHLIPASWSGHTALVAVDLLEQLTDAVWLAHGQAMHDATHTPWPAPEPPPPRTSDQSNPPIDFDDLPF